MRTFLLEGEEYSVPGNPKIRSIIRMPDRSFVAVVEAGVETIVVGPAPYAPGPSSAVPQAKRKSG